MKNNFNNFYIAADKLRILGYTEQEIKYGINKYFMLYDFKKQETLEKIIYKLIKIITGAQDE
jgi:hypothetical protein